MLVFGPSTSSALMDRDQVDRKLSVGSIFEERGIFRDIPGGGDFHWFIDFPLW